jgi:16S rRNA (uracil1498-N3)-methyltransferase
MRRFFVTTKDLSNDEVLLSDEVLHHLGVVLRLPVGEEILLLDGLGNLCLCRIESLGKHSGKARVLQRWQEEEAVFPVHLLQALPKGDKMELVLQKGTELGVTAFTPVLAKRIVPCSSEGREEKRYKRWERIIREAARQCQRPRLPHLAVPLPLEEALAGCSEDLRLLLCKDKSRALAEVLPAIPPRDAAILIGPEGGFAPQEAEAARQAGFVPVHIGARILRSETAGFAVASILQYLYGDLGAGHGGNPKQKPFPKEIS